MIVVCGEALIDLVPMDGSGESYTAAPGGSCANTAVALARLGAPVSMLARLSGDSFGARLRRHLLDNDVDLSRVVDAMEPASVAVATLASDSSAAYRFLVAGTADWAWTDAELSDLPPGVDAVHTGSLALAMAPGGAAVERFVLRSRDRATISVDPNIRSDLIDDLPAHREVVERCVAAADLVKVSVEDLQALHPGTAPRDIADRWVSGGPALVVITDGAAGLTGVTVEGATHCPAVTPEPLVDTIGAGDTVDAALLDWLARAGMLGGRLPVLSAGELDDALSWAARAAAITCSRPGADPPYRAELAGPA